MIGSKCEREWERREEKRRKLRVRAREIKNSRFESERTPFARKLANIPQSSQTATTTPDPPRTKKRRCWRAGVDALFRFESGTSRLSMCTSRL